MPDPNFAYQPPGQRNAYGPSDPSPDYDDPSPEAKQWELNVINGLPHPWPPPPPAPPPMIRKPGPGEAGV